MTVKMLIGALCGLIAVGGVSAALADDGDDRPDSFEAIDLRKDDSPADVELVDDDDDDDPRGDGDRTRGDDGTGGGDNTRDRTAEEKADPAPPPPPAPASTPAPAPAPAPVYDGYSDDAGSDG